MSVSSTHVASAVLAQQCRPVCLTLNIADNHSARHCIRGGYRAVVIIRYTAIGCRAGARYNALVEVGARPSQLVAVHQCALLSILHNKRNSNTNQHGQVVAVICKRMCSMPANACLGID